MFPLIACDCPRRDHPPDPPTTCPHEFVEEIIPKIKEWILEFYQSSVVNTCSHQALPLLQTDDDLGVLEEALVRRHIQREEVLAEHTKTQSCLDVGDVVLVQRQSGPESNNWEQSGVVVKVNDYDQYQIKMDGGGRVSLRDRQSLKEMPPVSSLSAMSVGREGGVGEPSGGPRHSDHLKVKGAVNTVGVDQVTSSDWPQLSDKTTLGDASSSKIVSSGVGYKSYLQALLEPPSML